MVIRYCDIAKCGKPLVKGVNITTYRAKRCVLINSNELSPCQKAKNRETAKIARADQVEEEREEKRARIKLYNSQVATRKCLKCGKGFRSEGKYNRICFRCGQLQPQDGMRVRRLAKDRSKITDIDLVLIEDSERLVN